MGILDQINSVLQTAWTFFILLKRYIIDPVLSLVGWKGFLIIILILLMTGLFVFRKRIKKYASSYISDYVVDPVLSFADLFISGWTAGIADVGDALAGIINFHREYKHVGPLWAGVVALEAFNFGLGFIPVIGEGFEFFFNFFPAAKYARMFGSKFGIAYTILDRNDEAMKFLDSNHDDLKGYDIHKNRMEAAKNRITYMLQKENYYGVYQKFNQFRPHEQIKQYFSDNADIILDDFGQLYEKAEGTPEVRDDLDSLDAAGKQLSSLIGDMLDANDKYRFSKAQELLEQARAHYNKIEAALDADFDDIIDQEAEAFDAARE
ncbi:MAG: hypothetical protein ABIH41_00960 [Nanoarchaeota archaeon]